MWFGPAFIRKDILDNLIYAADKYDMPKLKALAYFKMASPIQIRYPPRPGQIAEMLVIAEKYGSDNLLEVALERF